jgi:hypothetical protein
LLALTLLVTPNVGCGGGGGSSGTGGSGNTGTGNTGGGGPLAGPCTDLSTRLGGFTVSLIEEMTTGTTVTPARTAFGGGARNRARPSDVWTQEGASMDGCRLMVGPSFGCTPACATPMICGGPNMCIEEPRFQSAGTLTLAGLTGAAITIMTVTPTMAQYSWSPPSSAPLPYPPFTIGANISLTSTGATIPAFSLGGRGIEPLVSTGTAGLTFTKGEAFTFTWMAATQSGPARIHAGLEIAHHGGVAAKIECDLPDTGTATIPAPLLSALIDKGLFGFPELTIARATYDSTTTGDGCIDFGVVSPVARFLIGCTAPGMCKKSCNTNDDCTAPETCLTGFVCGT